ncbi:phasin family protein [Sphingomonas sp. LaA6.9]|uniref:phasin family protein n=1 Tax=Sphingomonas sp. LaA6.9 TaxID=2919914 RepID=UPI001F4F88BB|nr:phasin family protein [Sphingomonas sp. LaA6.9]MCJ8156557.1 phasin family protein [Sphingomonas sp. LaA6.9]
MGEGKSGTEALTEAGKKAAENSSAISLKMIDHAETNTREAFAAMRAAAQASSLSEVLRIQGDFIRDQGVRSMSLAREVGEMIVQFGKESLNPPDKG